jgi:hypothetical protein
LANVQVVQHFRHYILLCKNTIILDCNPMQCIPTRQVLGNKYSKWIVILQEFDLKFEKSKSKKSLVFYRLSCDLPLTATESVAEDSIPGESFFLIISSYPWYGYIIIYLQNQTFWHDFSSMECRRI